MEQQIVMKRIQPLLIIVILAVFPGVFSSPLYSFALGLAADNSTPFDNPDDRIFAVSDRTSQSVYIYIGNIIETVDLSDLGTPMFVREAGDGGWLVKLYRDNFYSGQWLVCHIDPDGIVRSAVPDQGYGPFFSGLSNGRSITTGLHSGEISLYTSGGQLLSSKNVWDDPDGWPYAYTGMGDVAGLTDGRLVLIPEMGASSFCWYEEGNGAGFTPYLYFYNNDLTLNHKVDLTSQNILLFTLAGHPGGGFVALGNKTGTDQATHLFFFDAFGKINDQVDIRESIPEAASDCYMQFPLAVAGDGSVLVSRVNTGTLWIFLPARDGAAHSVGLPALTVDVSGRGPSAIGGIGGSYFRQQTEDTSYGVMGFLEGYVRDFHTGKGLSNVLVVSNSGSSAVSTNGIFHLVAPEGGFAALATLTGYWPALFFFDIQPGDITYKNIALLPQSDNSTCPAEAALQDRKTLAALRSFRDVVLDKSTTGKNYIKAYYRHADELTRILSANPECTRRFSTLLDKLAPELASLGTQNSLSVSAELKQESLSFIKALHDKASKKLQIVLRNLKNDIREYPNLADGS